MCLTLLAFTAFSTYLETASYHTDKAYCKAQLTQVELPLLGSVQVVCKASVKRRVDRESGHEPGRGKYS